MVAGTMLLRKASNFCGCGRYSEWAESGEVVTASTIAAAPIAPMLSGCRASMLCVELTVDALAGRVQLRQAIWLVDFVEDAILYKAK